MSSIKVRSTSKRRWLARGLAGVFGLYAVAGIAFAYGRKQNRINCQQLRASHGLQVDDSNPSATPLGFGVHAALWPVWARMSYRSDGNFLGTCHLGGGYEPLRID